MNPGIRATCLILSGTLVACQGAPALGDSQVSLADSVALRKDPSPSAADASLLNLEAAPARMHALEGYPWLLAISGTATGKDVVTPPLGAMEQRPVVVAVHGAGDRPDWACGGWRIGLEAYPFVVCPVGQPMGQERYAWASTRNLATSIDRALNALHEKFGRYCSSNPMVYVGFSQGATLAGQYLIDNAARFPAVVLAEGGYNFMGEPWFAQKFFQGGGRRVLLLCGTPSCLTRAERARRTLERAGLNVIVGGDPKAGHNLNGTMQKAIRKHWHGLVSGMVGWETYTAHRWPE